MKIYKFLGKTSSCNNSLWILKEEKENYRYLFRIDCKGYDSCCAKKVCVVWHADREAKIQETELPEHLIPKAMAIAMKGDYYG